jgi:hypothetical protein
MTIYVYVIAILESAALPDLIWCVIQVDSYILYVYN